jgi:hypothetical protein
MRALLAASALLLSACAGAPAGALDEDKLSPPLAGYAADPFVPVNLYLNANEQATAERAALIEYAAQRLRDSGAFVRVDRGVQRWPITIQGRYRLEERGSAARRILGVLTLGLVRVPLEQKHVLVAEIFDEPDSIAVLELTASVQDRISPFGGGERLLAERAAVDSLLERMLAEVAQRKLIPRWRAFKPEPKKKAKPQERPT